ncbi:MAG: hypothetical protein ACE5KF_09810 [Kiloniellaceae bacterium]
MARRGLERVVVQPSAHGKDNRCTLDGRKALGEAARAVVDESVTDDELADLTALGARGIRFFMLPGGFLPLYEVGFVKAVFYRTASRACTRWWTGGWSDGGVRR